MFTLSYLGSVSKFPATLSALLCATPTEPDIHATDSTKAVCSGLYMEILPEFARPSAHSLDRRSRKTVSG
ncbi:MAG: hypothetical protein AMXMBFR4_20760 [Candidatus Hydrogenedentota bacterium]